MKVLVNAMSIKVGGALVLLEHIVGEMADLMPGVSWHLVLNPVVADLPVFKREQIAVTTFPEAEKTPMHNSWFYLYTLPRFAKSVDADVMFSMTNYLPSFSSVPTLLLVHNAGFFSPLFEQLHRLNYPAMLSRLAWFVKKRRIIRSVRRADAITVQTAAMAEAVSGATGLALDRIAVIPHGPGLCKAGDAHFYPEAGVWRIGFLTTFGVQKNFTDLFNAASILRNAGQEIRIVITLDPGEPLTRTVLEHAERAGISGMIENHGTLSSAEMQNLYDSLDIFVFTSLCESFGFPMVEAMSRGLPVVVAETPGNVEVCGADVLCYKPGDHEGLAKSLSMLMSEAALYNSASARSLERSRQFSWQKSAVEICGVISSLLVQGKRKRGI